ncbi:hypothetical protein DFJ73DRAFT_92117 [Zopfochytrium polystomum]|nr:hypothetical protein DFJ73DRAFT_92117 [Zopfochytrium polystomum]
MVAIAFYAADEVGKLADLIGEFLGEPAESGPFATKIKQLLEQDSPTKVDKICSLVAGQASVLAENLETKDFEKTFNLVIAIIVQANIKLLDSTLVPEVVKALSSGADKKQLRLKVLSNLYNSVLPHGKSRPLVFKTIVSFAAENDELEAIIPTLDNLDLMMASWGFSVQQKSELYLHVADSLKKDLEHELLGFQYTLRHLAIIEATDNAALKVASQTAVQAVKDAIRYPSVFNFEDVFRLPAVQATKSANPKLFDLLKVFLDQTLKQYRAFVKANPTFLKDQGIITGTNDDVLVSKIRLLSLATLAAKYLNGEMPYAAVAEALEIPEADVEIWFIDAIRAGLVDGKLNQIKKAVVVTRSTYRVFTKEEWATLGNRLEEWKTNLKEVLQVLANAKLMGASEAAAVIETSG